MRPMLHVWLGLPVLGLAMVLGPVHGAPLDPAQARGKAIYRSGTSPSGGEITAVVGSEGVTLPASAVPCASCHGPDGLGRPEGGVLPPNVRWSELTKGYGHVHGDGRRHPAFDAESLARLLRTGVDPGDNRLDTAMPLYRMSDEDMADLLAYLQYLEHDRDPGIDAGRIQVGTLLPLEGPQGALGQAMAQVMLAYFREVNAEGGIFGRQIELLAIPYGDTPGATLDNLRAALEQEGIFALVGAYTVGLDGAILDVLRTEGAPLIGPFTLDPGDAVADAGAFYLYPGFADQVRVLVDEAVDAGKAPPLVIGPEGERVDRLLAAVEDQLRHRSAAAPAALRYDAGELDAAVLAERIEASASDALLFLGEQPDLEALLDALDAREQHPRVYLLASLVPQPLFDVPAGFDQRIFLAYPTLVSDVSESGRAEYLGLGERHALPRDHLQGQIAAYAAAKLLVEGLRRSGRDLNRVTLIDALEALYAYKTGLTPPLTYGPNRRIGAQGAHVMAVDLQKRAHEPVGGWHEVR